MAADGTDAQRPADDAARIDAAARVRQIPWGELAGVAAVVLLAAVVFLTLIGYDPGPPRQTATVAPGWAQRLMALPPTAEGRRIATLDLEDARPDEHVVREEGAAVRLSFSVERPGRPVVLEERSGIQIVQLYPIPGRRSKIVHPGERIELTDPSGAELVITEPRGLRRVRLVVFPEDVDPLGLQPTELARLSRRLVVVERTYWAGRRGEGRS